METYEQFKERCKEPVDIDKAKVALSKLLDGTYTLSVPVSIDDPDIIISRTINELETLRKEHERVLEWIKNVKQFR